MKIPIEKVLNLYLHPVEPKHRDVFALMDERSKTEFKLSLLLLECAKLLEAYLNGGDDFGRLATLRARLKRSAIARPRMKWLDSLCDALGYERFEVPHSDSEGAELVAEVWKRLLVRLPSEEARVGDRTDTVVFRNNTSRLHHLVNTTRRISQLFRSFTEEVRAFGYHGSIGSNDHIQWLSDCDAVIILRKGVAQDSASLQRIRSAFLKSRRLMKRIDLFQHHGVYVLPEELFSCYPEDYFPIVLFQSSSFDIGGGSTVSVRVVASKWLNLLRTIGTSQYIDRVAGEMTQYNYYMFHFVLQLAQLLPCWVAACCQHSMNKRDAIPWFSERSSTPSQTFLQGTTAIRKRWISIWSSSKMLRGLINLPSKKKLREETTNFLGGRDQLAEHLRALARDGSTMAIESMRRLTNGA